MAGRIILGIANPALDANGNIDTGCTLQFYENGTTTPQATYTTPDLDVAHDNPLECDSAGRFPEIWGPDGAVYTVEITFTGESPITLDNIALTANPADPAIYYDMYWYKAAVLTDAETIIIANIPRPLTLPANLNDGTYPSLFTVAVAPTAPMSFTFYKNGVSIGSVSYATSKVATVTFASAVSFAAGDQFSVVSQATADVTGAFTAMTFVFATA